ncbi:hypothetical protein [Pseudomonas entomophila]|nr:hypothetical protein [Pseudomonas entomophila]MCG8296605.1 hypothetical protein [Pseudomonas entomophila]
MGSKNDGGVVAGGFGGVEVERRSRDASRMNPLLQAGSAASDNQPL